MALVPPAEDIPPFAEAGGDPFQQHILGNTGNRVRHLAVKRPISQPEIEIVQAGEKKKGDEGLTVLTEALPERPAARRTVYLTSTAAGVRGSAAATAPNLL